MSKRVGLSGSQRIGASTLSTAQIRPCRLAQAPERHGAVVPDCGAVDADIAQCSLVQTREQPPVATTLIPGDDAFDHSNQRASKDAKAGRAAD